MSMQAMHCTQHMAPWALSKRWEVDVLSSSRTGSLQTVVQHCNAFLQYTVPLKSLKLTHVVYLQIAWWKRAASVMDPPAAGSQSRWKPVASASLDTAPLYKRPNHATAPPVPPGRELLPLTPGYAAREAPGPFPALTMATSKSYVLLHKRRRPWRDRSDRSCTGPERRDAPSTPKTQLLPPPFPMTVTAPTRTGGPGTVLARGL